MTFKNENIGRIALILDQLVSKYPGRSLLNIIYDAGNLSGRTMKDANMLDLETILRKYLTTHD